MPEGVTAVLLDIEGTTTPIAFVHEVLFPFARARLRAYLDAHRDVPEVRELFSTLAAEHAADVSAGAGPPPWRAASREAELASAEAYARWLMDRDRKSPGLKQLQGWIWERGYREGELRGDLFPDVAPAIRRWRAAGLDVAIYSSGSVLAQKLLFGTTRDGDLTPLLGGFFDTGVGPKTSSDSYARIARALGRLPGGVVFVSDVVAELEAAAAAGLEVRLSARPGNALQPRAGDYERIETFDDMDGTSQRA